jgi:hypothetical protein
MWEIRVRVPLQTRNGGNIQEKKVDIFRELRLDSTLHKVFTTNGKDGL